MIRPATIQPVEPTRRKGTRRNLAERQALRMRVWIAVGEARKALPVKASRVAAAVGHSEGQESKIRNGLKGSPTAYAAEAVYEAAEAEALRLENAGYCSALIEVTLRAVAMWPELEKLTTDELHAELRKEIARRETRANGECNNLEALYMGEGVLEREALLEAMTQQATASTRIAAILQVLGNREE